jgi:hypothetical protein
MAGQLLSCQEIVRRLRMVRSQRVRHRPLTMAAIAARCGLSRVAVYDALHGRMGDEVQVLLSQVLADFDVQRFISEHSGIGLARREPESVRPVLPVRTPSRWKR